jgi:hypothetical protein
LRPRVAGRTVFKIKQLNVSLLYRWVGRRVGDAGGIWLAMSAEASGRSREHVKLRIETEVMTSS